MTTHMRSEFADMASSAADVLIIGAGINGISIARDLCLQGVSVILVDRADVMTGASAASSHMIHGGIRYLENGEFRLVRESVQERNDLLRTAPHVVKPLRTSVPMFSYFAGTLQAPLRMLNHGKGKRSERGAFLIAIGLTIYESFSRANGSTPRFTFSSKAKAAHELPSLHPDVKCVANYFDASVHEPERLALDLVSDALETGNLRLVTYAEAVGVRDGNVVLRDALSGAEVLAQAEIVVNASGPLTDLTNEALGKATQFMGGTKGSHIVVDHPELHAELAGRELFFENSDGRIVLIYPVKGRVLIGTTDIFADPREQAVCTEDEVDYFFDLVRYILPGVTLDRSQIVFRFSGIRPLPRQDVAAPGFVSRDYRIDESVLVGTSKKLFSVVGGKWTTFRALGEHVSGDILSVLERPRVINTTSLEIGGGKNFPKTAAQREKWITSHTAVIPAERVETLLERYGTRAAEVIAFLEVQGDDALQSLPGFSVQEITYVIRKERAVRLDDILLRRTNLAFAGELSTARVQELAAIAAEELGWTESRREEEIARAWEILQTRHGVTESANTFSR